MVDNLWIWHSLLRELKLEHLAPETILDWDKKLLDKSDFKNNFWFFKNIFGVHGKGINIFSTFQEYNQKDKYLKDKSSTLNGPCGIVNMKHDYILQKCIFNSHLIQDRKYILRVYTLTKGDGSTYIYNDCFYYTALFPKKYDYKDCYIGKNNKVYPTTIKDKTGKTFVPKEQMRVNVHVSLNSISPSFNLLNIFLPS